jgi:hypothetical protein
MIEDPANYLAQNANAFRGEHGRAGPAYASGQSRLPPGRRIGLLGERLV